MMHSSVGTGSLAYVVGSKVMDTRTLSRENDIREAVTENGRASCDDANKLETYSDLNNGCTDTLSAHERKNSSKSPELVSCRMSTDDSAYDSSYILPSSEAYNCDPRNFDSDFHELQHDTESFFDFCPLPVINLFQKGDGNENQTQGHEHILRFGEERMHSFQINNNVDLIIESNSPPNGPLHSSNNATDTFRSDAPNHVIGSKEIDCSVEIVNRSTIPDAPQETTVDRTTSNGLFANEDRVSEWLWTLHRIVIDVVRTDSHLEFYGDPKNMARMSDILAVYAWIDPATGYCQGMSDLLSPFIVLYEDNADAFWCFEMLLRRMHENFEIEGPTGVMKQLQALWKILELTDTDISQHLSLIGAESLHFAFRMLLVLFRRELSFDEAFRMWEMIWAADFDEALSRQLEKNCLDPLVLNLRDNSQVDIKAEHMENGSQYHCINEKGG
ncbi:putative small G protein signaling modulator 1 [Cocos nucifera]|nr:putative small G protein signaling modulator 1 [Cocos nucifera]